MFVADCGTIQGNIKSSDHGPAADWSIIAGIGRSGALAARNGAVLVRAGGLAFGEWRSIAERILLLTDLAGALGFVGLGPLLDFLEGLRMGGRLSITSGALAGAVFVEDGQLVGAEFGSEYGQAALDAVALTLAKGSFKFSLGPVDQRVRNIDLDSGSVRLRLRELKEFSERATFPSAEHFPVAVDPPGPRDELITVDRGALSLLLKCDGRRTAMELARADGLFCTLRRLARLIELGLAECNESGEVLAAEHSPANVARLEASADPTPEVLERNNSPHGIAQGAWARWRRRSVAPPQLDT